MPFQKIVNKELAVGVPGNFYDDTPNRVLAFSSEENGNVLPAFGLVCTADGEKAKVGGTGSVLGIYVDTHSVPLYGGLTPKMTVPTGTIMPVASFGHILVRTADAVTANSSLPVYNTATGEIGAVASGSASAGVGKAFIANAKFILFDAPAGGTTVIELNGFANAPAVA